MIFVSPGLFQIRTTSSALLLMGALVFIALTPITSRAQRTRPAPDEPESKPAFSDFRGVHIGMTADEARKKLGNPRVKDADQDLYVFNETQAVQVFYDKGATVVAISIDFYDGASSIPSARDVLGTEADARTDGSLYKMMRYPKAGYWVSYSRTAGKASTTTITIQKIEH